MPLSPVSRTPVASIFFSRAILSLGCSSLFRKVVIACLPVYVLALLCFGGERVVARFALSFALFARRTWSRRLLRMRKNEEKKDDRRIDDFLQDRINPPQ